jgi:hypothetical protein
MTCSAATTMLNNIMRNLYYLYNSDKIECQCLFSDLIRTIHVPASSSSSSLNALQISAAIHAGLAAVPTKRISLFSKLNTIIPADLTKDGWYFVVKHFN